VLGTLVGGLFDPHIVPWSSEMVGAVNGVLGINYWNWNSTGNPQEFTSLSNLVAGQANQVLALTRRDPNIMDITGLSGLNALIFNQQGSNITAIFPDDNVVPFYVAGMPQAYSRSYPRRKLITGAQGGAHYLRTHGAQRPHRRLVHSRDKQSACG
jgi:hypothetical protein